MDRPLITTRGGEHVTIKLVTFRREHEHGLTVSKYEHRNLPPINTSKTRSNNRKHHTLKFPTNDFKFPSSRSKEIHGRPGKFQLVKVPGKRMHQDNDVHKRIANAKSRGTVTGYRNTSETVCKEFNEKSARNSFCNNSNASKRDCTASQRMSMKCSDFCKENEMDSYRCNGEIKDVNSEPSYRPTVSECAIQCGSNSNISDCSTHVSNQSGSQNLNNPEKSSLSSVNASIKFDCQKDIAPKEWSQSPVCAPSSQCSSAHGNISEEPSTPSKSLASNQCSKDACTVYDNENICELLSSGECNNQNVCKTLDDGCENSVNTPIGCNSAKSVKTPSECNSEKSVKTNGVDNNNEKSSLRLNTSVHSEHVQHSDGNSEISQCYSVACDGKMSVFDSINYEKSMPLPSGLKSEKLTHKHDSRSYNENSMPEPINSTGNDEKFTIESNDHAKECKYATFSTVHSGIDLGKPSRDSSNNDGMMTETFALKYACKTSPENDDSFVSSYDSSGHIDDDLPDIDNDRDSQNSQDTDDDLSETSEQSTSDVTMYKNVKMLSGVIFEKSEMQNTRQCGALGGQTQSIKDMPRNRMKQRRNTRLSSKGSNERLQARRRCYGSTLRTSSKQSHLPHFIEYAKMFSKIITSEIKINAKFWKRLYKKVKEAKWGVLQIKKKARKLKLQPKDPYKLMLYVACSGCEDVIVEELRGYYVSIVPHKMSRMNEKAQQNLDQTINVSASFNYTNMVDRFVKSLFKCIVQENPVLEGDLCPVGSMRTGTRIDSDPVEFDYMWEFKNRVTIIDTSIYNRRKIKQTLPEVSIDFVQYSNSGNYIPHDYKSLLNEVILNFICEGFQHTSSKMKISFDQRKIPMQTKYGIKVPLIITCEKKETQVEIDLVPCFVLNKKCEFFKKLEHSYKMPSKFSSWFAQKRHVQFVIKDANTLRLSTSKMETDFIDNLLKTVPDIAESLTRSIRTIKYLFLIAFPKVLPTCISLTSYDLTCLVFRTFLCCIHKYHFVDKRKQAFCINTTQFTDYLGGVFRKAATVLVDKNSRGSNFGMIYQDHFFYKFHVPLIRSYSLVSQTSYLINLVFEIYELLKKHNAENLSQFQCAQTRLDYHKNVFEGLYHPNRIARRGLAKMAFKLTVAKLA